MRQESAIGKAMSAAFLQRDSPSILPVDTKKERVNMISALASQGEARYMLYEDSMDQKHLITFPGHMIRTSKQKIFLLLDNLRVHHGKMATQWVSRHRDKIELFFLPPYAPESNPDEYLNHVLKLSVHSGDLLFFNYIEIFSLYSLFNHSIIAYIMQEHFDYIGNDSLDYYEIGQRIRKLRKAQGLSRKQLSLDDVRSVLDRCSPEQAKIIAEIIRGTKIALDKYS